MLSSKKSVVVVGKRLRAYLGALLAVGFGTAWASFVPPPKVEAAPSVAQVAPRVPEVIGATRPLSSATAARITPVKPKVAARVAQVVVPKRRVAKRPRPPVVKQPPAVETLIATLDKLPVVELPPPVVVELPPAIELPPVPNPPDLDLPRIPTRSS